MVIQGYVGALREQLTRPIMQIETAVLIAIVLLLLEFLRRIRLVEASVNKLLALQGVGKGGSLEPSAEVVALARGGKKIEAMRLYREESGADVRQAKKVVDEAAASSSSSQG